MHELSLCQSAVELIEQQARQHRVSKVTAVWLAIGTLSCIEEQALRFCFDVVTRGTLAEGCRLEILYKPAQGWCWDCSQHIEIHQHQATCPHCQGGNLKIEGGDSLQIKEIEVE